MTLLGADGAPCRHARVRDTNSTCRSDLHASPFGVSSSNAASISIIALLLAIVAPLIEPTPKGRLALNVVNLFGVVAAVATRGHTLRSFIMALLLAAPALVSQWLALSIVEQLGGVLFVSILIARLAGVYPPLRRNGE